MKPKETGRAILDELSPILAGFKLAVILIGYFGVGSFAKWVVTYWYPFTRWIWDSVASFLSLPEFPLLVKDSLTALFFFLPLGVTAIVQKSKGDKSGSESYRVIGAFFGLLFLFVICRDVMISIFDALAQSYKDFSSKLPERNQDFSLAIVASLYAFMGLALGTLMAIARRAPKHGKGFWSGVRRSEEKARHLILKYRKPFFRLNSWFLGITFIIVSVAFVVRLGSETAIPIAIAMLLLFLILISLLLAILYAPKKLYVTTGASIAFILAAVFFEVFIYAKSFMEGVVAAY